MPVTFDPNSFLETNDHEQAIPVLALSVAAHAQWRKTAPADVQHWEDLQGFEAKKGAVMFVPPTAQSGAAIVLGLGENGDVNAPDPWGWAALADRLPPGIYRLPEGMPGKAQEMAALGWALAQYRFRRYLKHSDQEAQTPDKPKRLLLSNKGAKERAAREAAAVALVRDLVNTPANDMLPSDLERESRTLADRFSATVTVTTGDALLDANFPAIHAVGRASADAPRLIDLRWGREDAPKLTLVGKGVCFDSGGLDIKPANGMRLMKKDMGGAAHVLGLAHRIMSDKLDVRLRVLIPAVENAISGTAFRPGDIIKTRKGLSVEIGNTDAEGRLVLGDALTLACEETPDLLLDFATLTGAARVALGPDLPAFFTAHHDLADHFAKAAANTGDPLWRLPLWEAYLDYLDSSVADIANAGDSPFGGAITAALYLSRFITPEVTWAHFDVYAWNQKPRPGRPAGGEAMALRAAFSVIQDRFGAS
ncbi:M17 family metallopeptidase [Iodidimonas gelatinilytica]|uniref:leucyl aminopeptidase family protein n=1 Tax=Iodidimonas gelatinilytica TaxID=1236966 RepID=UPI0012312491